VAKRHFRAPLRRGSSHATTLFRASLARIGTMLAMVVFVLATFGGTGIAGVCADPANVVSERRVTTH